jgi:hypothetical protein
MHDPAHDHGVSHFVGGVDFGSELSAAFLFLDEPAWGYEAMRATVIEHIAAFRTGFIDGDPERCAD